MPDEKIYRMTLFGVEVLGFYWNVKVQETTYLVAVTVLTSTLGLCMDNKRVFLNFIGSLWWFNQ